MYKSMEKKKPFIKRKTWQTFGLRSQTNFFFVLASFYHHMNYGTKVRWVCPAEQSHSRLGACACYCGAEPRACPGLTHSSGEPGLPAMPAPHTLQCHPQTERPSPFLSSHSLAEEMSGPEALCTENLNQINNKWEWVFLIFLTYFQRVQLIINLKSIVCWGSLGVMRMELAEIGSFSAQVSCAGGLKCSWYL